MVLTIPVASYPQRGESLKLAFDLTYNGTGLTFYQDVCTSTTTNGGIVLSTTCTWSWSPEAPTLANGSHSSISPFAGGLALFDTQDMALGANALAWPTELSGYTNPFVDEAVWFTPDGGSHPAGQTSTGQMSFDGSGIQAGFLYADKIFSTPTSCSWDCSLPGVAAGQTVIATRDGVTWFGGSGQGSGTEPAWGGTTAGLVRMDADGNYISSTGAGYADTVGRSIPYPTAISSPNAQQLAACAGTLTTASIKSWAPPGYSEPFLLSYGTLTLSEPYENTLALPGRPLSVDIQYLHPTTTVLQSLVLPNGKAWTFGYTESVTNCPLYSRTGPVNIGDVTEITFPTGGTISYGYTCVASQMFSSAYTLAVSSRTVNANDGTGPHTWTYDYANGVANLDCGHSYPCVQTVTVTDPLGNDLVQTLTAQNPTGTTSPTRVTTYYSGPSSSGTVLKTDTRSYPPQYAASHGFPLYPSSETVVTNGLSTQTVYQYCCDFSFQWQGEFVLEGQPYAASYGKVTDARVYDYTTGTQGTLLRETKTNYLFQTNSSYFNPGFLDLKSSETTLNGSGTQVAQTSYGYDQASRTGSGIGMQISTPLYPVYGHQTTKTQWLNAGTSPTTTTSYWDTGEVYQVTDPLANSMSPVGNPTTYSYSSTYAGSLPTKITNPLGQFSTMTYDLPTGHKLSVTDPNSQTTSYTYSDPLNRLTNVQYPDVFPGTSTHGETEYCYNDTASECGSGPANAVFVTQVMSPTQSKVQEVDVDGLGRKQHLKLTDPAGNDVTDFTYDALGRSQSVSNPYRTTSDPTYGITSCLYDALGRKTYQCQPDNATAASTTCVPTNDYQSWSYNGNVTTFFDENKNQWQRTTDALGRLTQVSEPNGSGASPTLTTAYGYDALDNLLSVKQSGLAGTDTPRSRSFAYDSLSRLVCASNPENSTAPCPSGGTGAYTTGTTGYGYDANGNLTSKTDARGVTTTYSYDALNRLLGKTYANAPPGTLSSCYQYDTAANGVGRLAAKWTQSGACSSTPPSDYQSLRSYGAYDAMGRALTERQCAAGYCTSASMPAQPAANCAALAGATGLQYCYDLAGDLLAYSNGLTTQAAGQFPQQALLFSQTFDAAARLNGVGSSWTNDPTHPQALFSSPTYTPFNALSSWLLGAQLTTGRSYDNRLRVTGQSSAQ